jgi:hypothetical protein
MVLPTGKSHLSFSEIKMWKECSWKHKLFHINKILLQEESPHLHYGTIVHAAIEDFLRTRVMLIEPAVEAIADAWDRYGFDGENFIEKQTARAQRDGWKYRHMGCEEWQTSAKNCLQSLPAFLDSKFHSWRTVDVEHELYEQVDGLDDVKFKGFIDAILLTKDEKGKKKVWMLDWKTASPRGWDPQKQRDFMMQAQLMLYKTFWASKMELDIKDIACAFVLLKKSTKPEKCIQMIPVSVGPKAVEKSQKLLRSAAKGIQSGLALKNRDSCKFCEYRGTEHCT